MRRQRVGRFIGATGAACASLFWGFIVLSVIVMLLEPPTGWRGIALIFALPMGVLAAMLLTVSVHDVIVLWRRTDFVAPGRVAVMHLAIALLLLYMQGMRAWIAVGALLAVSATQVIAIRLFQMTPSHASSQR